MKAVESILTLIHYLNVFHTEMKLENVTSARYKAKYGQGKIKRAKSQERTSRHRVCITLISGSAIFAGIFEPYQGKGLLEICNRKQTRKYDYMLNKVACKKENKAKSKLKKRD